ncbi:MAG: hypothetical protein ABIH23_15650, partial [bacterium]
MKKLFTWLFLMLALPAWLYAAPYVSGGGGGDMLKAENLSGLSNYTTARTNMGIAISSDIQAYSAFLQLMASLSATPANRILGSNAAGDGMEMKNSLTVAVLNLTLSDSSIPWPATPDCSAVATEGSACWDTDNDLLYVGDGATQKQVVDTSTA